MPKHYILIDYENVQPEDLGPLEGTAFHLRVFVGSQQTKLATEFAMQMQQLGSLASYVRIEGHGRNALDFHIAYELGKLATEDPGSSFHVITKDTGFDVLLERLRKQGISCARLESLTDLHKAGEAKAMTLAEELAAITDHLIRMKTAKPRSLKTLQSTINKKCLDGGGSEAELARLVEALQKQGFLHVDKNRVTYASDTQLTVV